MSRTVKIFISLFLSFFFISLNALAFAEKVTNVRHTSVSVSATEDLMREHGLLSRILLIYDKEIQVMKNNEKPNYSVIFEAATIVKNFIENYHEKLEESYIFPRFAKDGELAVLVKVLKQQHNAGRQLTSDILKITSKAENEISISENNQLKNSMKSFIAMYMPHKAREDTVLFPAFHKALPPEEYNKLGDIFEDKEHELFGDNGFEMNIASVVNLEKQIGIYDLMQFTPKAK